VGSKRTIGRSQEIAAHVDSVISMPVAQPRNASTSRLTTEAELLRAWWGHLLLGFGAGVLGFACAFVFATVPELPRPLFVLCYLVVASPFIYGYVKWSGSHPVRLLCQHWVWGVIGTVAIGAFVVFSVLRQEGSARPEGLHLAGDLLVSGSFGRVFSPVGEECFWPLERQPPSSPRLFPTR
jgi:hypothetical protein